MYVCVCVAFRYTSFSCTSGRSIRWSIWAASFSAFHASYSFEKLEDDILSLHRLAKAAPSRRRELAKGENLSLRQAEQPFFS